MATIDDVYNIVNDPAIGNAHLAAMIQSLANQVGAAADLNGDTITVYLAKTFGGTAYAGDLRTEIHDTYLALSSSGGPNVYTEIVVGGPGTLRDWVFEAKQHISDVITAYLQNPPAFTPPSNILMEIRQAVIRTIDVAD